MNSQSRPWQAMAGLALLTGLAQARCIQEVPARGSRRAVQLSAIHAHISIAIIITIIFIIFFCIVGKRGWPRFDVFRIFAGPSVCI